MARALTLGNGQFLVCLDEFGFVRDLYYPYVGLENHVSGEKHRIGVMVGAHFSWLDDGTWKINIAYKLESMVGYLLCKNEALQLTLVMEDVVYNESATFIRQVDLYYNGPKQTEVKLFFHQVFHISESKKRNTAFYDPTHNAIVHYKGRRVFIVNGQTAEGVPMDDYSVGAYQFDDKEGVFRDAEDGILGRNAVEHGSVDSVIRFRLQCQPKEKARVFYWICAGRTLEQAYELSEIVSQKTPVAMIRSTEAFWRSWLKTNEWPTQHLSAEQKKLFETSLFILRCHIDNRGAIIASADSEMIEFGKDDYSYMWPRDAAFIVSTMAKAGFPEVTKPFFQFCKEVLHPDGYLHHRYRPDQSLGSTWHSTVAQSEWLKDKILQLPIQEDETASVLVALWHHFEASRDLEFIESLFKSMIERMADFLVSFRNKETGLPLPSYDLWEERMGISTYTCASVYGGLMAAARFCELLEKRDRMRKYQQAAKEIREATIKYLFSEKIDAFVRFAHQSKSGELTLHEVVDASSLYGLWYFGMIEQSHPLFVKTLYQMRRRLKNPATLGGYIRYERDEYFKDEDLPNPWLITTMWEALRKLAPAECGEDALRYAEKTLNWIEAHKFNSGVLSEQLNPYTGAPRSATPLVWSHAVYVELVLAYLAKKRAYDDV